MSEVLNVTPIENLTLQERAYQELKKALLTGQVRPGQTLNLRGLAAALGTSVMPVRDAVGRLAAEQALELMPNRAIRVPVLDRAQFDELWQLRIEMEGKAAALAAERATPEEIAEIAELCAAVRAEAGAGDVAAMLEANSVFHFAIYRSARTYILLRIIETLRMQSRI